MAELPPDRLDEMGAGEVEGDGSDDGYPAVTMDLPEATTPYPGVTTSSGFESNQVMPVELADLVGAARNGDRTAFDELVKATYAGTYTLAYRLTGNEEDARDVVQDAYLRAYKGLRRFRGDARFTTWLYRITANCASTHMAKRTRARHEQLDEDTPLVDGRLEHDPEGRLDVGLERERVAEALADLPPRLRSVIVLRDVYDLPHEAIATELGISEAAAKVRLHRARRKLRERLFPLRGEQPMSDTENAHAV
jgi:RNA polymerase sigma-70 factor (ECF subfamily)